MQRSPIFREGNNMGISISTARAHKVRTYGDLTVIFTWMNDERAMVLLPTYRKNAPWFVIADSAAHKYLEPRYVAQQAAKAAEVLGMESQVYRLGTLMVDNLEELVLMPSKPPAQISRASFGQVIATADGREIGGDEIRVEVGNGVTYE